MCAKLSYRLALIWIVEPKQTEIEMFYDSTREKSTFRFWTILVSSVGWFWGQAIVLLLTKGSSSDKKVFLFVLHRLILVLHTATKLSTKFTLRFLHLRLTTSLVVSLALKWESLGQVNKWCRVSVIFKGGGCDHSYSCTLYHLVACQKKFSCQILTIRLCSSFSRRVGAAVSHLQASRKHRRSNCDTFNIGWMCHSWISQWIFTN